MVFGKGRIKPDKKYNIQILLNRCMIVKNNYKVKQYYTAKCITLLKILSDDI